MGVTPLESKKSRGVLSPLDEFVVAIPKLVAEVRGRGRERGQRDAAPGVPALLAARLRSIIGARRVGMSWTLTLAARSRPSGRSCTG
jgi:hypothetical protein